MNIQSVVEDKNTIKCGCFSQITGQVAFTGTLQQYSTNNRVVACFKTTTDSSKKRTIKRQQKQVAPGMIERQQHKK
jgi:hypothetical protein